MLRFIFAGAAAGALFLAGCGGGGGGGGTPSGGGNPPTNPPSTNPPGAPASEPLQQAVAGSMAWVGSNDHTLYVFSADSPGVSNCNSGNGCTAIWPPYTAPAGTTVSGSSFTLITRSDGTLQWAFNNQPLYDYSGDTGADQDNGQGIVGFGGTWTTARPAASATSTPGSGYMKPR